MKNDLTALLRDLEDLAFDTRQLSSMANALYAAMFEGPNSAKDYDLALFRFTRLIQEHADDVRSVFEYVKDKSETGVKA